MGSLFSRFGAWFVRIVSAVIINKIVEAVREYFDRERKRKESEADAKKRVEDLKQAKTKEEIDAAADRALDKF